MKKYVLIGDATDNSHIIKWVKELSKYFDVYLISFKDVHSEAYKYIESSKCYAFHLDTNVNGGNTHILKQIFKVNSIIKTINPDIVNAHYITSNGLIAALIKKIFFKNYFLIQSAWGSDILVTPFRNFITNFVTKFILNSSNLITSDSEFMTSIIQNFTKVKVETFTFGLETLPKCDLEEKDKYLFFSNRALTANYNIDKVIDLFYEFYIKENRSRLIISHSGNLIDKLLLKVKSLGLSNVIDFVGFINHKEMFEIYKKTQYYISLPTSDSTAVTLLEAMGHGCIPILSDLPANNEWVNNGVNGVIWKGEIDDVFNIIANRDSVFNINRNLIERKAIFPTNLHDFLVKNNLI